jgi:hypothetical protein
MKITKGVPYLTSSRPTPNVAGNPPSDEPENARIG